jgi:hypothetical protein
MDRLFGGVNNDPARSADEPTRPKKSSMVRRRSTVRFRKEAPGQRLDSKDSNSLVGPI